MPSSTSYGLVGSSLRRCRLPGAAYMRIVVVDIHGIGANHLGIYPKRLQPMSCVSFSAEKLMPGEEQGKKKYMCARDW